MTKYSVMSKKLELVNSYKTKISLELFDDGDLIVDVDGLSFILEPNQLSKLKKFLRIEKNNKTVIKPLGEKVNQWL